MNGHQPFTRRNESRQLEDGMDLGCMLACAAVITTLILLSVVAHALFSQGMH